MQHSFNLSRRRGEGVRSTGASARRSAGHAVCATRPSSTWCCAVALCSAFSFIVGDVRSAPKPTNVSVECTASKNNDGCETFARCPEGTSLRSARVGCNLEWGSVTPRQLSRIGKDVIKVVKSSDNLDEGRCWLGETSLSSGRSKIEGLADRKLVSVGCQEHDENGGDCQIRGVLRCE